MTIVPVTKPDRSEARKIAGPTISSGFPARPSGVCSRKIRTRSGLVARTFSLSGVSMKPGPMALTRTPSLPSSAASARVDPQTAFFRGGVGGRFRRPDVHERLDRADIDDAAFGGAQLGQKGMRHIE